VLRNTFNRQIRTHPLTGREHAVALSQLLLQGGGEPFSVELRDLQGNGDSVRETSRVPRSADRTWPADYYPILKKVAASREPSGATRTAFYQRVRETLSRQLAAADPPHSRDRIEAEQLALEQAIARIEVEHEDDPPDEMVDASISERSEESVHAVPSMAERRNFPTGILLPLTFVLRLQILHTAAAGWWPQGLDRGKR